MDERVVGLDLGTTAVKAVSFDLQGHVRSQVEVELETYYPEADQAEQSLVEIEVAVKEVLRAIFKETKGTTVLAVGISAAMHSVVCVSASGEARSNALIWSDARSSRVAREMDPVLKQSIYQKTGTPIHPMSPFVKLVWMKESGFAPNQGTRFVMSIKEYLIYKWTGKRIVDYSIASASGLMNLETLAWDEEVLTYAGVSKEQLSEIVPPTTVIDSLTEEVKKELDWPNGAKLVIGAADGQLANLGSGAIGAGEVAISAGTSGAIRQLIKGYMTSDDQSTFSYVFTEDTSIIGGPTNNGGIVLQWLKDLFEFDGSLEDFQRGTEKVPIGSDGLLFVPYINGERAPVWDERARGNFYGLNIRHKRTHLIRAALEGIAFNLYKIGKSLEQVAGKPTVIRVNGGLSKSKVWVQILADLFMSDVVIADTHHASAWGAAWTALVAIGYVDSFEAIKENIPISATIKPNIKNHEKYQRIFEKYERLESDINKYFD